MFNNRFIRVLVGLVLGALAGVSLCIAVLPLVLQMAGLGDQTALSYYLNRHVLHAALIMAVGGSGVARTRHPLAGALVLGPAGVITGAYLAFVGLGRDPRAMAYSAVGGLVYGLLGGLILGRILVAPPGDDGDNEPDPHETAGLP